MPELPSTIFKYEALSMQSLLNLKKQSIYFGSPKSFNDPYDCTITAAVADPADADLEALREKFLSSPVVRPDAKDLVRGQPLEALRPVLIAGAKRFLDQYSEEFLSKRGVTCFSATNTSLLMWAHYGGQHQGFCLEFRTDFEPFRRARPVRYVGAMPTVDAGGLAAGRDTDQIFDLYCTKSEAWSYEREWRVMHREAGTLFTYEPEALKACSVPASSRHFVA